MTVDWRERITVTGQIVISMTVIIGFFVRGVLAMTIKVSPDMQRSVDNFDIALIGAFSLVMGFWIGSSRSSEKKDQTIAETATVAAATAASAATIAAAKP